MNPRRLLRFIEPTGFLSWFLTTLLLGGTIALGLYALIAFLARLSPFR